MTIKYFPELLQGSDEWFAARCGLLTASEMHRIITPTLKVAANSESRSHVYELLAQRVTNYVEPSFVGFDMVRGKEDEIEARALYVKHHRPVREMGFVTNDKWGFTLGYSPDALVGEVGAIECKSRCQKYQAQTIIEYVVPAEFNIQLQTGMLVAELEWIDFVSYCGGMPMATMRVQPDPVVQDAIINAARAFEIQLAEKLATYHQVARQLIPTERRIVEEMHL